MDEWALLAAVLSRIYRSNTQKVRYLNNKIIGSNNGIMLVDNNIGADNTFALLFHSYDYHYIFGFSKLSQFTWKAGRGKLKNAPNSLSIIGMLVDLEATF